MNKRFEIFMFIIPFYLICSLVVNGRENIFIVNSCPDFNKLYLMPCLLTVVLTGYNLDGRMNRYLSLDKLKP